MGSSAYQAELEASCPSGWRVVPLTDAVFFQEGPGILAKDFHETGVPLIRLKGVEGDFVTLDGCDFLDPLKVAAKWNHFRLDVGDLVISTSASFGRVSEVSGEAAGAVPYTGLIRFRPRMAGLERSYLRAFLSSTAFMQQVEAMASGSVIRHFGPMHLKQMALHLPPIEEQRSIGDLSNIIADRLRLLRQTNATLEAIAQALFKSWFVDFDPVRAKAEGREPEGMDAATAAIFPSEFEESELGLIPKGWQFSPIQQVVEGVFDGPHATPAESTDGPVFLGIKNLSGTALNLTEIRHIREDDWPRWTKRVTPRANDIVFSYEAALGLFALIPPNLRCCLGRRLALVRTKSNAGTPHFWFHQFISARFQRLLSKHTVQGATVNRIALKEFPSFPVLEPRQGIRNAFEHLAAPLWARIHLNQQQALELAELRDTLLPRLISGKLRLPRAEAAIAKPSG